MSLDDTNSGGDVKSSATLPDACHRNVVLALHAVRTAGNKVKITDRWLKSEFAIGQEKQAARLLRFLRLVDSRKKLGALEASDREDWTKFRELLIQRVQEGCRQIGVEPECAAQFGSGSWDAFQDGLAQAPALAARSERSRANVVACFRALANICEMDQGDFEAEITGLSARPSGGGSAAGDRKDVDRILTGPDCSFPIGRQDHGKMVYARIAFSQPMQPGDLRRLAEILQTMDVPAESRARNLVPASRNG